MDEIWKEIPDTNYSVSNFGRVASRWRGGWRILRPSMSGGGYPHLVLYLGKGRTAARYVHTLVAEAFLGPRPTPKHEPNHLDGARANNRADNLAWSTRSENVQHAYDSLGRVSVRGEASGAAKLTEADVREIRRLAVPGTPKDDLARQFGVAKVTIYQIVGRRKWGWLP